MYKKVVLRGIPQKEMMWKPSPPDISHYPLSTDCSPTTTPGSKGLQGFQIALVLSVWAVGELLRGRSNAPSTVGRVNMWAQGQPPTYPLTPEGSPGISFFAFFGHMALKIFWPLSFYQGLSLFLLLILIGSRHPLHTEKQKLYEWIWSFIKCQAFETIPHWEPSLVWG